MVWSTTESSRVLAGISKSARLFWCVEMNSVGEAVLIIVQTNLLLLPGNASYPIAALCCVLTHDILADRLVQMFISNLKAVLYPQAKRCSRIIYKASYRIPPFKARKGQQQSIH